MEMETVMVLMMALGHEMAFVGAVAAAAAEDESAGVDGGGHCIDDGCYWAHEMASA